MFKKKEIKATDIPPSSISSMQGSKPDTEPRISKETTLSTKGSKIPFRRKTLDNTNSDGKSVPKRLSLLRFRSKSNTPSEKSQVSVKIEEKETEELLEADGDNERKNGERSPAIQSPTTVK